MLLSGGFAETGGSWKPVVGYAHDWVKKTDPSGHLQMPISRMVSCPNETSKVYRANTRNVACPIGYSREETIKTIWSQ